MIRIYFKDSSYKTHKDWHIGQYCITDEIRINDINYILADDYELKHILDHITGIRMSTTFGKNGEIIPAMWFGDDAKFIVANYVLREEYYAKKRLNLL